MVVLLVERRGWAGALRLAGSTMVERHVLCENGRLAQKKRLASSRRARQYIVRGNVLQDASLLASMPSMPPWSMQKHVASCCLLTPHSLPPA